MKSLTHTEIVVNHPNSSTAIDGSRLLAMAGLYARHIALDIFSRLLTVAGLDGA